MRKYHHYESIESTSGTTTSVSENVAKSVGDSDIKKFYREIRPGCTPVVKQPGEGLWVLVPKLPSATSWTTC